MNLLQPWNLLFAAGFVAFFAIRHPWIKVTKRDTKSLRRVDAVEKVLLGLMAPGTVVLPSLYLLSPWLSFADYRLPDVVQAIGAALMVASLWLFWRSHADLGRNWSVSLELREGHEVVTRGVYRRVRHPMYAAIWAWAIAQGLLLENWLAGWAMLPAFAAMYFVRTPREERMMLERFGAQYAEYARSTGRLVPRLRA